MSRRVSRVKSAEPAPSTAVASEKGVESAKLSRPVPEYERPDRPSHFHRHREYPLPIFVAITTYFSYALLVFVGHLRDFFGRLLGTSRYFDTKVKEGYSPLLKDWENFYTRRLYHRLQDVFNRPICSSPGAHITIMERTSRDGQKTMETTTRTLRALNLGSYNYLGFADDWQESCSAPVLRALDDMPVSGCSSRMDMGSFAIHDELEQLVARFVKKEAAIVFNQGYATNFTTIPALVGKGSLIISDALNHSSIVNGSRGSSAAIRVFQHNDPSSLEAILREAISLGQPRTHRPWKKILVMVEGIYSMEGAICNLRAIVDVARKYKAFVYVDEAHSIGALGSTGRGVCEYSGVDPSEVDVLMGTFTKSYGGMGGYIAGDKKLIEMLRAKSAGLMYHTAMSPVVCAQILQAFRVIMGEDGTDIGLRKIAALRENSNYFRHELEKMGLHVYGDYDSPIIPVLLYQPAKIAAFSRECLRRGMAVVTVGFPATSLIYSRVRVCISAGHTRQDMDEALDKWRDVVKMCKIRYNTKVFG